MNTISVQETLTVCMITTIFIYVLKHNNCFTYFSCVCVYMYVTYNIDNDTVTDGFILNKIIICTP